MSQVHHIHRQQLVLETTAMPPSEASAWHQRLERLQHRSLLPALNRQLDALAHNGEVVELERVEIHLSLADIADIDEDLQHPFRIALAEALERATRQSTPKPSALNSLIHFLQTGNFPASHPPSAIFRQQLEAQVAHWGIHEWRRLAKAIGLRPHISSGRLTQVQGTLKEQCVNQLLAALPASEQFARRQEFLSAPERPATWQRLLSSPDTNNGVGQRNEALRSPRKASKKQTESRGIRPQNTFFVPNAGLILLHPYLKYLAIQRGALNTEGELEHHLLTSLLHYAVSQDDSFREWEHPLTKILLGLPPDAPLQPVSLSPEDKVAVNDLLRGIIKHWKVLKRTSPEGLRQGFLQRPGKLVRLNGRWQLTVERQAQDLLLTYLPWSIGLVKTPWMNDMLQIDWP